MSDLDNELLIYDTTVVQCNCSNALEFWIGNTAVALPTLAPTALDIVSALASQAYVECACSQSVETSPQETGIDSAKI